MMSNFTNTVLYTGVTNNLERRVQEHRSANGSSFTSKYKTTRLVYFEYGYDVRAAIAREKQIKAGSRQKKVDLINNFNPQWKDLYNEYFESH